MVSNTQGVRFCLRLRFSDPRLHHFLTGRAGGRLPHSPYSGRQATYELRRLTIPDSQRYQLCSFGARRSTLTKAMIGGARSRAEACWTSGYQEALRSGALSARVGADLKRISISVFRRGWLPRDLTALDLRATKWISALAPCRRPDGSRLTEAQA